MDDFVVNPSGACHSIPANNPAYDWIRDLATNRQSGWRMASREEIAAALRAWGQGHLVAEDLGGKEGRR